MSVVDEITCELTAADTVIEATIGAAGVRAYALEAGMRICAVPAVRAGRVDSAELIGFIHNTVQAAPHLRYDDLARAVVAHFDLGEEG